MLPHATIIVGCRTQDIVKVSFEDLDFLMQWPWTYAVSHPRHGGLVYARRSVRDGFRNVTLLMHRIIITERMGLARPSDLHFVDHENGDSLDNRRENDCGQQQLRWLTNKENMGQPARHSQRPGRAGVSVGVERHSVLGALKFECSYFRARPDAGQSPKRKSHDHRRSNYRGRDRPQGQDRATADAGTY